eukprot:8849801-Pyramimonas_sp.AAC.1
MSALDGMGIHLTDAKPSVNLPQGYHVLLWPPLRSFPRGYASVATRRCDPPTNTMRDRKPYHYNTPLTCRGPCKPSKQDIQDNRDGTFQVTYVLAMSGKYKVTVIIGSTVVGTYGVPCNQRTLLRPYAPLYFTASSRCSEAILIRHACHMGILQDMCMV